MQSFLKYMRKAKEIRGDQISQKLFDEDGKVVLDENSQFKVLDGDARDYINPVLAWKRAHPAEAASS